MTPDQEKMLLRELAISACERLGVDLDSESPTAVRLTLDMSPIAATPDIDIVGYTAFLADQEQGKLLKDRESPGDEWLGEFTYDLEKPCLTKLAADEYRDLRDERERLRAELKEVQRQHGFVAGMLKAGIEDRLDPSRLIDPDCSEVAELLSASRAKTREEARRMLAGAPELDEKTAKIERQKASRKERTLRDRAKKLRQTHGPRIEEINQHLHRLCTKGEAGVLSPVASDRALSAWAFVRVNKALINDETLHRRARNQFIEAQSGLLTRANTTCTAADEPHAARLDRQGRETPGRPANGERSDADHPPPRSVETDGWQSELTRLDRELLKILTRPRRQTRLTFDELREAWTKNVSEHAIAKALKRLREKLPRKDWYFEISEASYEVIWIKQGQFVP